MEHHHPIMSNLRELVDQTYRQTYRPIPRNATTEALESLVTTLNFIDIWLKLFDRFFRHSISYFTIVVK